MNTPPDPTRCSDCGAVKPAAAPCPHCLLQLGLSAAIPERDGTSQPRARPTVPTPDQLTLRFPGLEIQEAIGQGGMGVVYRARHKKLDRLVALKILSPELEHEAAFAERFLREARAMARLDHANIVAVYDFGETEGMCWLLMEHVDGINLRTALQSGAMTPERALAIVPQLCDALQTAHDLGIVHRDIKPENVLLDREGRVKIADFGLAKLSGHESEAHTLTQSDVGMGTLHYSAPEQLRGAHTVDHRADIYSLGVVFYEMLTGQLPIGRFALPSAKMQLDVRLDEVVLRALENEPALRYQQAAEVKTDVQSIRDASPPRAEAAVSALEPQKASTPPAAKADSPAKPSRVRRGSILGGLCIWVAIVNLLLPVVTSWGMVGIVLLVLQGTVWLYLLTRLAPFGPADLPADFRARSRLSRVLRGASFAVCASFGLTGFGAGVESMWEMGTFHYATPTSPERGSVGPWTEEYGDRLMRMLPEYSHEGAEVPELGTPQRERWLRNQLPNPAGTFLIAGIALWLAGICLCWREGRKEWTGIATPLLGTLLFSAYVFALAEMRQSGETATLYGIGGSTIVDGGIADVRATLMERLENSELVVAIGENLVDKRTRSPLARHELIAVRPKQACERWSYAGNGPRRLSPGLVIDLVSGSDAKTAIAWNAGLLHDGDSRGAVWRENIESLFTK